MHISRSASPIIILLFSSTVLLAQVGQISIPRIDQMPNQPAPYNVRNWKQVALRYDSFVYDVQKTGQYLPLCYLKPTGVNYPQNPTFGLHTYVGTNSPFGNEAINVLPSIVGASLVGADKSNQFGRNWVQMSQDFFNKANGENLYLNNAGASSGSDWWYDLMPNMYFYQLYNLYPNLGAEADAQFTTIADRFLDAVRAMGGSDAPWEPAYMNYRAWKFKTMEPLIDGVKEPEAAGPYAWVLYHAWKKTGNPEYLKGAEWAMEFLSNWQSNPSYELQLPYGTYIAAKMNAELGTKYDVEKMVNWSFNRGELRGWGTAIGTWGGFDVAGLVGEANDAGNDYVFQMNGLHQAAALVPMVRYDKRFARAIGKWMLNLANANRLYYPGFLPSNLQDASAWSNANDPQQVIGYEALRQKYQGLSPYSTGDALQGGWAATNLALYGTSSIGYLGCLIEKTNVDKILRLDLRKTDFYGVDGYPTYLYYNPLGTAQLVQLDAGPAPKDVYEALSESFVQHNASGLINLSIPANQAILVTLTPAGGTVTYEKNKMLVNGLAVDFNQHAQSYTRVPRIQALAASKNPLESGTSTSVFATVTDGDSGQISYSWSTDGGNISGTGAQVTFNAPTATQNVTITLIAADPDGNRDTATLEIPVVPEINVAPQITGVFKSAPYTATNETIQVNCVANDSNNDPITYTWSVSGGSISGTGSNVNWTAPSNEGIYQITVKAADSQGLFTQSVTNVLVKNFNPTSGNLVAHYPFTGNANDVSGHLLHGQANGAILVPDANGVQQSAYYFNGGAQHIAVPNSPLLNFQDGITLSVWLKPSALPAKETFVLSHGSWQNRWKLSITPDKFLRWTVNTLNGVADLDANEALQVDSLYHVVVTYDGAILALYMNGSLRTFKPLTGKIRTTTYAFLMGQMLPGTTDYNFKGVLDAVKIFDYALTPDAVRQLSQLGVTGTNQVYAAQAGELILSPNPATDRITVRVPANAGADARVLVHDVTGQLVSETAGIGDSDIVLNLKNCKSGTYTVSIYSKDGVFSSKFIKI
ncbi:MAG: LamG-like jellyroll fold domain-containing protein [Bacteroidota bacterium]